MQTLRNSSTLFSYKSTKNKGKICWGNKRKLVDETSWKKFFFHIFWEASKASDESFWIYNLKEEISQLPLKSYTTSFLSISFHLSQRLGWNLCKRGLIFDSLQSAFSSLEIWLLSRKYRFEIYVGLEKLQGYLILGCWIIEFA